MHRVLFILLISPSRGSLERIEYLTNPRDECPGFIKCETSEKPHSCPSGTFYRERVKVHGCCPGCVVLKGEDDVCRSSADCQPGLKCNSGAVCVKDTNQACEYYKRNDVIWMKTAYWKPECLPDGTFAPKQCKGEKMAGKCFCVDKQGKRIFGEEDWSKAENMTCACSRSVEKTTGARSEISLHCDPLGNFEPLQCDQKVCWCATPATGAPYTLAVPLEMMTSLPCHSGGDVGIQYHRQCDSAKRVQEVAKALLANRGTKGITLASQSCNFDGSFHRVQTQREKKKCVFSNNSPLTEAVESENADCNCAHDRHVATMRRVDFDFDCLPNGNYRSKQVWNGKVHCVDGDGFYYSDDPDDCKLSGRRAV